MVRLLLAVYVFLIPFENLWGVLFGSDTVLKPYRLVGLALVVVHVFENLSLRRRFRLDTFDKAFIAIFVIGQAMAMTWYVVDGSSNMRRAISDGTLSLFAFLVYLVIKRVAHDAPAMGKLLRAFVAGTVLSIVIAYLTGVTAAGRFSGFYANPNSLAVSVVASLFVIIAWALFGRRRGGMTYLLQGALVLLLLITLLFTGSRGAIIGAVVSLPLFGFSLAARSGARRTPVLRVAALFPIVLIAGMVLSTTYEQHEADSTALRRYDMENASRGSGRLDIWRAAWLVAGDHYYLGVGTNQYPLYHRKYIRKLGVLYTPTMAEHDVVTHSDYVDLLTSFGIVSLLIYLWMLVRIYLLLRRRLVVYEDPVAFAPHLLFPLFVFIMIVESFANFFVSPQYFFFMALITAAASRVARSPK